MGIRDIGMVALGSAAVSGISWLMRRRRRVQGAPILNGWPRVVIVGAGFGGLRAARALDGVQADVLVVDRHNYHCFQPLLYQVATAGLEPEEIAHPVRQILRGIPNVRFQMTEVRSIDLSAHQVIAADGPIPFDYLIVAAGSTTNYFGNVEVARKANGLKGLNEAVSVRNHLLECFERASAEPDPSLRASLLTFAIAGGGPTGVELAGALAELIRLVLAHDYVSLDVRASRVILVEGGPSLLPALAPSLQKEAIHQLRRKGVDVRTNAAVKSFDGDTIVLGNGEEIASKTLLWAAGVRGVELGETFGQPLQRAGRVKVEPTLQLPGHPNVYVIGDLAHVEQDGKPLPMVAPAAIQGGECAAENIRRQIAGEVPIPLQYHDKGSMATIGRNSAVCQIGNIRLTGFAAWVAWLVVHLVQIVGFRNRILVLTNWIWDYFLYDRAVRLITRD